MVFVFNIVYVTLQLSVLSWNIYTIYAYLLYYTLIFITILTDSTMGMGISYDELCNSNNQ